jgi:anti-anti-sigma factor
MEITVSQQQGRVPVTVLTVTGDIDADSYGQLEAQAKKVIQDGARDVVIDLTGVPYISSYGIRGISQIFNWLRDKSKAEDDAALSKGLRDGNYKACHLKLVNPVKRVYEVLTTTGVDMFLEIHKDLKQAVASF